MTENAVVNMDGRPNRRKKDAFSNLSGLVCTGPKCFTCSPTKHSNFFRTSETNQFLTRKLPICPLFQNNS